MLAVLTFEFYRFRFQFCAASQLYFPPFRSGNIVRGALGSLFRKLVCKSDCQDAKTCPARHNCPYAVVFEPKTARGQGPSGLEDWPRPFVFRAAHLDGRTVRQGERFHFDVHSFDLQNRAFEYFVRSFAELAQEGLGPGRGRAELIAVDQLNMNEAVVAEVFSKERFCGDGLAAPCSVCLKATRAPVGRVRIRFVTPTELKSGWRIVDQPEFGVLVSRLRDRISTLRALYGAGPLEIDFREFGKRAAAVRMIHHQLRKARVDRVSSRSGQRHPLGGFVGEAEYEGQLAEFLPYLRLGKWVGVGRQTVWGKGELEIAEVA
jgi:hypothetical protein